MKTKTTKGDIIIILAALLTAVLLLAIPFVISAGAKGASLVVSVNGKQTVCYPLDQDRIFSISNNEITISVKIESGYAEVYESNCKDKICLHTAKISRIGQSIICAPAEIVLTVKSDNGGGDSDAVAG